MEDSGMMGLMVLGALAVYLLVSIWVTKTAASWAKANNKQPWLWGGLAAFAMYNLVFWDWIPTLVMHKYYCDTQAGFWVYKTPEQWKAENPELTKEDLKTYGEKIYVGEMRWSFPYKSFNNNPNRRATMINSRIYLDSEDIENVSKILPVRRFTSFIADAKNDERLAQQVTFGSGYGSPMTTGGIQGFKGWLEKANCSGLNGGDDEDKVGVTKFINEIVLLGEKND